MKNKTEHRILFGSGGCLTKNAVKLFIDGGLSDGELKKIKHHIKKCPLCKNSLEGAKYFSSGMAYSKRINAMYKSNFRRSLDKNGRSRKLFYGITSAAASIALLFGIIYIIQLKDVVVQKNKIAENREQADELPAIGQISDSLVLAEESVETETKVISENTIKNKGKQEKLPAKPQKIKEEIEISEPEVIIGEPEVFLDDTETDVQYKIIKFNQDREGVLGLEQEAMGEPVASNQFNNAIEKKDSERPKKIKFSPTFHSAKKAGRGGAKSAYYVAEVMPMFRGGGVDKFSEYVADSLKVILPDTVLRQSIVVGFRIDTMGNVDRVHLISGTDSEVLNNHVLHIIEDSPQWIPASISGRPVESEQEVEVVLGN